MSDFIFNNVELVHLDIKIWGGERNLERGDFDPSVIPDLPDEKVATLGRKKLIDTKHLKPMSTFRHQAHLLLEKEGVRFMGGYAIPDEAVRRVSLQLSSLCDEFALTLDQFISRYDELVDQWASENPDFANVILESKIPAGIVRSRCKANFAIYRVASSNSDPSGSLQEHGSGLMDKVLQDAFASLQVYVEKVDEGLKRGWDNSFRCTVRSSIKAVAEKLRRFAFSDTTGGFLPFAAMLEDAVQGDGKIEGPDYKRLERLLAGLNSYPVFFRKVVSVSGQSPVSSMAPDPLSSVGTLPAMPTSVPNSGALATSVSGTPQIAHQQQDVTVPEAGDPNAASAAQEPIITAPQIHEGSGGDEVVSHDPEPASPPETNLPSSDKPEGAHVDPLPPYQASQPVPAIPRARISFNW